MPAFKKPEFVHHYSVNRELAALVDWRDNKPGRQIPAKTDDRLLVCSWNIANLGLQSRFPRDYRLMAGMLEWFDLIAVQEVNDNLDGLREIADAMGEPYRVVFSDKAGNNERLAFVYDSDKLSVGELIAEIAIPSADKRHIKIRGLDEQFTGFDRHPYVVSFDINGTNDTMAFVNVHLYFGSESNVDRRALEAFAVGRWCDKRSESKNTYVDRIVALGDFNIPKVEKGDPIFDALTKKGLEVPEHSTRISATIASDKQYDQISFMPGPARDAFVNAGVFDFDGAVFAKVWDERTPAQFKSYLRYYLSDHRPVWAQFTI